MRLFLGLYVLFISISTFAGEIELKGTYQGKDLYVRNPYMRNSDSFCVTQVLVNGRSVLENPKITALRINLSSFARGEYVTIKIIHADTCTPEILNPEVLKLEKNFRFLDLMVSNNSIDFSTEGESLYGRFIIEKKFTNNDLTTFWEEQFNVDAKGDLTLNRYSVEPKHDPGDNTYRLIYEPLEGDQVFSEEIVYTSTIAPITFFPFSVTNKITFSDYVEFEISDSNGRILKFGNALEVNVQDLKPGEYFVKIQNRYERFVKK